MLFYLKATTACSGGCSPYKILLRLTRIRTRNYNFKKKVINYQRGATHPTTSYLLAVVVFG